MHKCGNWEDEGEKEERELMDGIKWKHVCQSVCDENEMRKCSAHVHRHSHCIFIE